MSFDSTRNKFNQTHFEVLEVDLPVITGLCTLGGVDGFGTPLTCDQEWTGEYKTYYFTNTNAPILPNVDGEPIWRCIKSIRETPPEIKPGQGLASRGSLSVTVRDFSGQDPNTYAQGVTSDVKAAGTYFGKLDVRQIVDNKPARLKLYRLDDSGKVSLTDDALTKYFILDTLEANSKTGDWVFTLKDALSIANIDDKTWPVDNTGYLRQDIDDSQTNIPVDSEKDYSGARFVRIGDEILVVESVTDNLTSNAVLNTKTRGLAVYADVSGELLTTTQRDSHSGGDEVFICPVSDNEKIDELIARILTESDISPDVIPTSEWADEVAQWHPNNFINALHIETLEVNDILGQLLTGFLMDLWYSDTENKIKLSAISVWKESSARLTEGVEINYNTINKKSDDSLRATRAIIAYDKRNVTEGDETGNYKKGSTFADDTLIGDDLFTKHKDKVFEPNRFISGDVANLLTQRYVSRFKFTPYTRTWTTDEKNLTFKTGDVVDISSSVDQNTYGQQSDNIRGQILSVKTNYTQYGRDYTVKAMTYEAAFENQSEIVISSPVREVDLYILAGAPSEPVELTFVFDSSYSSGQVAIRAGAFKSGSKLILILANGFDGQADGGKGGTGQGIEFDQESSSLLTFGPNNGSKGGTVYDAQGIDTDIYFSGSTPSAAYPDADGYIRAPSGGDGGFIYTYDGVTYTSGNGGNGGDGRAAGQGGNAGFSLGQNTQQGNAGLIGSESGPNWGVDGAANGSSGGLAGSGIIDSGATVTLFGADATRYINGNGDH